MLHYAAFTVHPSAEWKPYSLELSGQSAARTSVSGDRLARPVITGYLSFGPYLQPLTYQLVDNGTAWLDLMQLIPKN